MIGAGGWVITPYSKSYIGVTRYLIRSSAQKQQVLMVNEETVQLEGMQGPDARTTFFGFWFLRDGR